MRGKLKFHLMAVVLLSVFVFSACNNDDDDSAVKKATVEVRLTDGPGDYQQVNIDIEDVQINPSDDNSGWISLMDNNDKGIYDLLTLTNGQDTLLGSITTTEAKISQIRLILGTGNTVKVGDQTYDLITPSAQQSGLKLNLQQTLSEGVTYKILLDFDAAKSIVARGNGTFSLKPVIRVISEATSGSISGTVSPVASNPAIYALSGTDTVNTSFPDETGKFLLKAMPAGTYKVTFEPAEGYVSKQVESVIVTTGNVTSLGTVTIEEQPPL
jgi:hypothetical protein